jgi:hypothetical protein
LLRGEGDGVGLAWKGGGGEVAGGKEVAITQHGVVHKMVEQHVC